MRLPPPSPRAELRGEPPRARPWRASLPQCPRAPRRRRRRPRTTPRGALFQKRGSRTIRKRRFRVFAFSSIRAIVAWSPLSASAPAPAERAAVSKIPGWSHQESASCPWRRRAPSSVHSSGVGVRVPSSRATLRASGTRRPLAPYSAHVRGAHHAHRRRGAAPLFVAAPPALLCSECATTKSRSKRRVWSIAHPPE